MTNYADKGITTSMQAWYAVELDGVVVALCPSKIAARRIEMALRNAAELENPAPHQCPVCDGESIRIVDSRKSESLIHRVRECEACKARWRSHERMVRLIRGAAETEDLAPESIAESLHPTGE